MQTLRCRRCAALPVVLALAVAWVLAGGADASFGVAGEPAALPVVDANGWQTTDSLRPDVRAAILGAARGDGPRSVHGPAQAVQVETQNFEGATFPPAGWQVADQLNPTAPKWAWGRETCDVPRQTGGSAGAWSHGGGTSGEAATCWASYSEPVLSVLAFPGIDATSFVGGIQVKLEFKADFPQNESFRICWMSSRQTQAQCKYFGNLIEQGYLGRWLRASPAVGFPEAAGHSDVAVMFLYQDEQPSGSNKGVLIDNVVIEGLPAQATETPTGGPPTEPPQASRTPMPTEPPAPPGQRVFLPLALKSATTDQLEPPGTVPATSVSVEMGTQLDETGQALVNPGTVFQYGHLELCQLTRWERLEIGTAIRWQWYFSDEPLTGNINVSGQVQAPEGAYPQCIHRNDGQPMAEGTWRVAVWVGDIGDPQGPPPEREPDASVSAVVQQEAPPGATTVVVPTSEPTSTPRPTAEPGTYTCTEHLVNGSFEQGATAGWSMWSNLTRGGVELSATDIITRNESAVDGDWLALLPGSTSANPEGHGYLLLYQTQPLPQDLDPTRVVSATIEYYVGLVTQETQNGMVDDWFSPMLMVPPDPGSAPQGVVPLITNPADRTSEETQEAQRWYRWRVPLPDDFVQTISQNSLNIGFMSENNATSPTTFFVDQTSLQICQSNTLAPQRVAPRGIERTAVGGALPRVPAGVTSGGAIRTLPIR